LLSQTNLQLEKAWASGETTSQPASNSFEHFWENLQYGAVIIEEKIEGEESSFQAFCDGKHLVPLPETRDYKRAFDGDRGQTLAAWAPTKMWAKFYPS
jgi:phosphoribosylamine-glycine ligase